MYITERVSRLTLIYQSCKKRFQILHRNKNYIYINTHDWSFRKHRLTFILYLLHFLCNIRIVLTLYYKCPIFLALYTDILKFYFMCDLLDNYMDTRS